MKGFACISNLRFGVIGTLIGLIRLIYADFFLENHKEISVNQSYQPNLWPIKSQSENCLIQTLNSHNILIINTSPLILRK